MNPLHVVLLLSISAVIITLASGSSTITSSTSSSYPSSSTNAATSSSTNTFWRYAPLTVPTPLAFWTFQEPTGTPRHATGIYSTYVLIDGNASAPIEQSTEGIFGPYSALFPVTDGINGNNSQRLYIARENAPGLTTAIGGPNATVTLISWIKRSTMYNDTEGMIAGVWNEYLKGRQYAIFTDLGACHSNCPVYNSGLAAHISNCGGPTPGNRYCITRACDPRPLPADVWHCLANVYNGTHIIAYVNGTLALNGNANPYYYPGGIYNPEILHQPGAEFGVGANVVNQTVNSPPVASNRFSGKLGGLVVFAEPLSQADVAAVCGEANGFETLRVQAE